MTDRRSRVALAMPRKTAITSLALLAACASAPAPRVEAPAHAASPAQAACPERVTTTRRIEPSELESDSLESVHECLADPLERLVRVAPGMRHMIVEEDTGEGDASAEGPRVGRTYTAEAFRLADDTSDAALERMVRDVLEPDPMDFVFYANVERIAVRSAESFATAIRLEDVSMTPAELAALEELSGSVPLCPITRLLVYSIESGWADATGSSLHGFALVDTETREALWIHVEEIWST